MALRDQPYIPLYVKDFIGDEKLRMCSPAAVGVYIFLMCILHREKEYGKLKLKRNFVYTKPDTKAIQNTIQKKESVESLYFSFAENLAKQMPFKAENIQEALMELDYYGVIRLEGETLIQPRMVKDGELSETRRKSVKKRWDDATEDEETKDFVYTKPDTKPNTNNDTKEDTNTLQNTEYENAYIYNNNIDKNGDVGEEKEEKKTRKKFTPPTVEEVEEYCRDRNNGIDAGSFVDFYTANGWVQGKQGKPIKDWKACVRYWETNGIERHGTKDREKSEPCGISTAANKTGTRHTTL